MLPGALAGRPHDRQPLDLVAPQAAIEHSGNGGQQVAHRVGHAGDVRPLDGEPIGRQAAGQFRLAQGGATLLLVELACFLDAERALDEREATAQFVLGKMPGQRDDFTALRPWPKQARYAEEAFVRSPTRVRAGSPAACCRRCG